ncbi:MAG: V-type ATP synthase subunit I [Alistipes sp.]|nr:V-type ATP synthase subunit I [Alistipes sp.]
MTKYAFVVLESDREDFLARLQQLGLVDVTITGREPSERDAELVRLIDSRREVAEYLRTFAAEAKLGAPEYAATGNAAATENGKVEAGKGAFAGKAYSTSAAPYSTSAEAIERYAEAREGLELTAAELARYKNLLEEVAPWGEFDPAKLRELARLGVPTEDIFAEAGIDTSQGIKLPDESPAQMRTRIAELEAERDGWSASMVRAAATLPAIDAEIEGLKDSLQFYQTATSGMAAADGTLVVMEAWAREKQAAEVDKMLTDYPGVIHLKDRPTPQDDTPVELHNSRIVRPFEFIGEMYALPKYGTMDLTRWFAPFYMLFFAFCLADAGYGLLIFGGGLALTLKGKDGMKTIGKLSMWCGGAAVVFGFLVGSLFGLDIKTWSIFAGKPIFFPTDSMFLFSLALALGVLHILFGLTLKAITLARAFGLKYAMSTVGWIVTVLTGIVMLAPGMMGMELAIPKVALYVSFGVGGFLMLFMNNPGKNPLVNLGGGLWNTYNDITGFLSDALSYIRLFAIGLSGGVLAMVFNDLAAGMSGDIPVLKQLIMLIILLIGHGLNLFMSALSSMVHPLRLTFVEFYKNSGFENTTRIFNPLKQTGQREQNGADE